MKNFILSILWTVTVMVTSGQTTVNASLPDASFDSLLSTIQGLANTGAGLGPDFLSRLWLLI